MIELIGANRVDDIFTFYYHNTKFNWYYKMSCTNVEGVMDIYSIAKSMSEEEFNRLANKRIYK